MLGYTAVSMTGPKAVVTAGATYNSISAVVEKKGKDCPIRQ